MQNAILRTPRTLYGSMREHGFAGVETGEEGIQYTRFMILRDLFTLPMCVLQILLYKTHIGSQKACSECIMRVLRLDKTQFLDSKRSLL